MKVSILVGSQWGDEGKGKIVDILSSSYNIVARYQGGANAGHTVIIEDEEYVLHLIPSGILRKDVVCVIGNGTVIDPQALQDEISFLEKNNIKVDGRLFVSKNAHVIMPYHKLFDNISEEGEQKIGTTGRGIGPCYVDKYSRIGIRMVELFDKEIFKDKLRRNLKLKNAVLKKLYNREELDFDKIVEQYSKFDELEKYVKDVPHFLNSEIENGKSVLLEGAQGAFLDVDHGTYPFVTSSSPTAGGACIGTGISPTKIDSVIGIVKAYTTRVGEGSFPTELKNSDGEKLQNLGHEFGATTGRPRRCGWFDANLVRYSNMINNYSYVALTKLDVLSGFSKIKVCTGYKINGELLNYFPTNYSEISKVIPIYNELEGWNEDISECRTFEDLPSNAQNYINFISEKANIKVGIISVGPKRSQTFYTDFIKNIDN